uniref:Uncharacterized protein n=1 Tax=Magallana gigas TaxID=29159 RepID=A0A8W8KDK3_MAGGI
MDSSYDELTYNAINRNKVFKPEEKKPERMTKKQFDCMKNRKLKKDSNLTRLVLPMFARNIKKFKESPGYKQVREDFASDGLFVFFCDDENSNFIVSNQKQTAVKVYLRDNKNFPVVKAKMIEVANELQESEDLRHRSYKRHARPKYWSTDDFEDDVGTITDVGKSLQLNQRHKLYLSSWGIKDLNLSVFLFRIAALKVKESSKAEFKKKRTNKKKPKKASVLSGGHCLQCLAPFVDIHATDRVCRHHPGFIVHPELVWSCCDAKSEESSADYMMHQKTGQNIPTQLAAL